MNTDQTIAVCAIVAGITASLVGGTAALALNLILGKISELSKRIGSIEGILIKKGLHEHVG